jgi:hypothetical protein
VRPDVKKREGKRGKEGRKRSCDAFTSAISRFNVKKTIFNVEWTTILSIPV